MMSLQSYQLTDMSVVHACNESCQFTETIVESGVERELVQSSKLVLKHTFYIVMLLAISFNYAFCDLFNYVTISAITW